MSEEDVIINYLDFKFALDGADMVFLIGIEIDYKTDITGSHIEITNPQSVAGCGCGVSIRFT